MIDNNTTEKKYISQIVLPPIENGGNERLYLIKDKNARDNIETLQSNLTSLNEEINTLDTKVDNLDIPDISNLVTTDNLNNKISNLITKNELDNTYVKWSALASNYSNNSVLNNNYAHTTNGIIDNATVNYTDVNNLYDNYAHTNANGTIDNALIDYTSINNLYNNYAHINNGEIDNATIDHSNINNLETNYAHITNNIIDNANINYANVNDLDSNYAHINNGIIDNATIDFESVNNLETNYAHITNGTIDNANINQANVNDLDTNYAHIKNGIIDNATIDQAKVNNLDTNYAHINNGIIDNATIDQTKINNLNANYAHISNGTIDNATIDHADINGLNTNYAHISRGVIDNAIIDYAKVNGLSAHYAYISDGVISNAFIDQANVNELDTHYAEIDMANVNNAWIENGVIKDAAISDAKIAGVSANKITAGTIDAANVNVINLRADNLTVTKINGQPVIGGYTLVDSSISGYSEKNPSNEGWYELYDNSYHQTNDTIVNSNKNYYTTSESVSLYDQNTIDNMLNNINERIDSQIETWTIDTIPLLNNEPAVNWTTNDEKDEHIGDICYVVNAASDYDGFTYRFAYDNTSHQYSWVLIQDNQVTAALGRITNLESFNNQLVNWDEATDEGVITVRGRITALSGRIDKTVKSSIQLWYTKADTTTPAAPTSQITSTSTNGGAWTTVVPIYDEDYPNYFYCWQYQYEDNTYGWSAVIYDQAITETQEAARTVPPDLLDYISDNIETIQEQVLDGQLEIWYGSINPSLNNAPVNEWSSNKYEDHIGDLYYNITNGSVWQWTENNSTYSWLQIPDSAASAALAAAQNAQATADGKRKIFTTTPTAPYDIGDLWVTGSTVKYANVAKTSSQTYSENDWSLTATDDTTANANIKSSIQLWYTSNSTTSPNKPYTDGSTNYVNSTSTNGNIWTTVVPVYNSSTPKYHYCYQQQRGDGKYQWTIPVYDDATTTAMAKAQNALSMSDFETFEQTTFKNVTDTINEQTTSITNLTTIIDNNGLTENTTITNTVNTVSQKANNNESKISSLTTALGTNEDGTSKENDIIHQVSDINQNLDSITTRVGKTEASLKGTYATSSTAANVQNKEATIFPAITNFELYKGAAITVKFINNNTISNPTLNINSSGAKPIKTYSGANLSEVEYAWRAGSTMTFVYDETNWCIQDSTELTRIKNAETIIDQTANNVLIKATENDSTAAQGGQHIIQSLINVAPEGIKISADKVNIEGAAIFSDNGRLSQTSLNNTYASVNDIPSDLSDLTDNNNVIPSDISNLTDNNSIIPSDLSDLTDENSIIPDISGKADKSSAIAEEQIIYIQAVSGTNSINAYPSSATTTSSYWITQTGESIPSGTPPNSNSGQTPRWTLKRPSYQKNYPIVFVAKQRKTVSGVITCTIPIKDDTTTIIDGGHITTGIIDASQVTVNNIHADSITVGTINGNQITNGAINFDKLDSGVKDNINTISDAATTALNNLATIENVVDTLTWVTEHGTMTSTTDTAIDVTKVYFILDNNGDYTVGNNKYSIVQEPNISNLSNYYELTIDKSVQNYIATHLSLTNEGLWLTPMATGSNGCKVLIATGSGTNYPTAGTYIIDRDNNNVETIVAQFTPNGISFAENRSFYIGDNNAFIYFDGNGHINIGGSQVTIGGNTTLQQLLNKYNSTITSDDISVSKSGNTATITIGNDSVNIVDGAAGEDGAQILGITTAPSSYTTTINGFTPTYRIALSTVKTQSGASEVKIGDILAYSYYHYPVGYADASYVYCGVRKSIRGETGAAGHSPVITTTKNNDGSVTINVDDTPMSTVDAGEDGDTPVITTTKGSDGSVTIYIDGVLSNTVEAGANGTSYYTYIRYSANADGNNMVITPTTTTKYIGIYTGTSSSVPSYAEFEWSKYVGEKGNDADPLTIISTAVDYQLSTSGTTEPTGTWSETPLAPTTTQYLWTRTTLTFSDNTTITSYSVGGKTGQDGAIGGRWYAGTNITGTSTTATAFSGSGITAAVVGDMYFNTSTYNTYRCTVAGNASTAKWVYIANIKGQAGTNGVSITGVEHQYYLSTSSTSQAGGSWTVKPATYVKGRYYWERWKISFSSGDPTYTTATLAEEVTSAWTAIEENDEAIALKANSSDVYTKTTVDEKISQEVTDRNAAITTKANEITSSVSETYATKTEFNNLEIGGRNLLRGKSDATVTSNGITVSYDASTHQYHVYGTNTKTDANWSISPYFYTGADSYLNLVASDEVTLSTDVVVPSSGAYLQLNLFNTSGNQYAAVKLTFDGTKRSATATLPSTQSPSNHSGAGFIGILSTCRSIDVTFRVKLEKGNKATDWTPAPEDIETRVSSAESAITQNANNIALKVSESDVTGNYIVGKINLDSTTASIAAQHINLQGAVTISDLASDAQNATLNSKLSVGGRNLLTGTGDWSDWYNERNDWTFSGEVATRPVRSTLLWASLNSVGIPLEDCYGRTFTLSLDYRSDDWSSTTGTPYLYVNVKTQEGSAESSGRKKYRRIDGSKFVPTTDWQRAVITFTVGSDESWFTWGTAGGTHMAVQLFNYSLNQLQLRHVKLEVGNTATDWTPAPEDQTAYVDDSVSSIQVGGRNLLKKAVIQTYDTSANKGVLDTSSYVSLGTVTYSRGAVQNMGFYVSQYALMEASTDYVISFKAKVTSGSITKLYFYSSNPNNVASSTVYMNGNSLGAFNTALNVSMTNGTYYDFRLEFTTNASIATGSYTGQIIQWNKDVSTAFSVEMSNLKWEKGNKPTDWSPAPEDVDSAISNAAKTATSYVTEITGQNGIMVHPSTDQTTGVQITSDVDILRGGTSVANYGTTARIGTSAGKHVSIDSDSVDLMDGNASLATFGANDTHIGMSGTGNVYMANDKFLLSAQTTEGTWDSTEGSVTTSVPYTEVKSGFKAQNIGTNYRVYSGLNSTLGYNDDGGYTASDTYIDAWVEDSSGHELHRAYVELWADPLDKTAIRLHGDSVELLGDDVTYVSPYNSYPLQLGKPVVRSANKSMSITSTNTWVDGPSVYLDQGQWLVVGVACFNTGSSSGNRKLRAQLRLDTSVYAEGTEVRVATNEYGRIQATAVMTVGSADGLDATLVLSSSMSFTTATTSYVTAVQLA